MNLRLIRIICFAAVSLLPAALWGQADSVRLITRATMIGVGGDNILDTYLSAEKFSGLQLSFISNVDRQHPGRLWGRTISHRAAFSTARDRTDDNRVLGGMYDMQYRWMRQLVGRGPLTVKAGVGVNGYFDVLYLTANGNNPVQLHFGAAAVVAANASYGFTVGRLPFTIGYDFSAPLLGISFSPAYGQSYYELFSRGDYDHNVVCSQPFNMPSMRQMLTIDLSLRSISLRLGYLGDYRQSKFNDIKYHEWQHLLVVGVVKRFKITTSR